MPKEETGAGLFIICLNITVNVFKLEDGTCGLVEAAKEQGEFVAEIGH